MQQHPYINVRIRKMLLIVSFFPVFKQVPDDPECSVKEQENGKNYPDFFWKVLEFISK